jgi:hypothetical protein
VAAADQRAAQAGRGLSRERQVGMEKNLKHYHRAYRVAVELYAALHCDELNGNTNLLWELKFLIEDCYDELCLYSLWASGERGEITVSSDVSDEQMTALVEVYFSGINVKEAHPDMFYAVGDNDDFFNVRKAWLEAHPEWYLKNHIQDWVLRLPGVSA